MKYFESKQIHSSLSSWSSNDVFVHREIDRDTFLLHRGEKTVSRKHGFSLVYAESDKRFYQGRLGDHATNEQMQAHVATYVQDGWIVEHPFLAPALSAHHRDEETATVQRRTQEGYVIPRWSADIPPAEYQGGFSNTVFLNPQLFDYVKNGGCHGFIGHSVRKPKLDAYLETQFLKASSDESLFAMWLTSTGGRHFGDSLEGCTFEEQKACIRKNVSCLIEQAKGYADQAA